MGTVFRHTGLPTAILLLLVALLTGCKQEPKPVAIDLTKPALQQGPKELWRTQVATRPPSEEELAGMDYEEQLEARGWVMQQPPIVQANGAALCVSTHDLEDPEMNWQSLASGNNLDNYLNEMLKEQFRLLLVSSDGRRLKHKEFEGEWPTNIYPDTSGRHLALVVGGISDTSPVNQSAGANSSLYAVADDLTLTDQIVLDRVSDYMGNFRTSAGKYYWIESDYDLESELFTTSETVRCADQSGKILWEYQIPKPGNRRTDLGAHNRISVDVEGNLYIATAGQSVLSLDKGGDLRWNIELDLGFNQHPLVMPDGSLVVVGNRSGEIDFPVFDHELYDFEEMDYEQLRNIDFEARTREMMNAFTEYSRKVEKQPGQLIRLSNSGEEHTSVQLPAQPLAGPLALGADRIVLAVAYPQGPRLTKGLDELCTSRIMCFDLSGGLLWDRKIDDNVGYNNILVVRPDSAAEPQVVLTGISGRLYSLSPEGELLWSITDSQFDITTLAVREDGCLLIVSDGDLVCYELPDSGASGN